VSEKVAGNLRAGVPPIYYVTRIRGFRAINRL
jgi:hypothetical protein